MAPNPLTPEYLVLNILLDFVIGGLGSCFVFLKVVPFFNSREGMHPITTQDRVRLGLMGKLFSAIGRGLNLPQAKKYPDHIYSFILSYVMKGGAFIPLFGLAAILLTSTGWRSPLSWDGFYYDLLFARSNSSLNAAHLVSYVPIPLLGLYVAYKFRTGDGLLNSYLGLLVSALGVAIHETLWMICYYGFYAQFLTWGVLDNVLRDIFFGAALLVLIFTYRKFPFQKIPLSTFRDATTVYLVWLIIWALFGFHISSLNNFVYGKGTFGITQWYADPQTNFFEVASWDILYIGMFVSVWRLKK